MERIEMLNKAMQLAHDLVDGERGLNDAEYESLRDVPADEAVRRVAERILDNAHFDARKK